jgi:Animal haem peroxidase
VDRKKEAGKASPALRVRRKAVRKLATTAIAFVAAFLLLSASQTFGASRSSSCAAGNVDGRAPKTAMCFGRMFPHLPPFRYSDRAAADLAATMKNPKPDPPGRDRGTSDDSRTLPSEYTYLGQFIDHNLDFDETPQPTTNVEPSSVTNFESFRFDLNNIFGGGPAVDPQLYASDHKHLLVSGTLGSPQSDGFPSVTGNGGVFDLARNPTSGEAITVDPRDDENQIVSQITAAFIAFYNDFVNRGDGYARARQLTEDYYQEIVLTDVLPAFVGQSTIKKYLHFGLNGSAHVHTPNFPNANFTPIEFSVGAYRFGHSLVRNDYHINDIKPRTALIADNVAIFNLKHFQTGDLSGGGPLPGPNRSGVSRCSSNSLCTQPNPAGHQIEWKYFVPKLDADQDDPTINFARQTQPTISPALFNLPAEAIPGCTDAASPVCNGSGQLVSRDLARGNHYGLASGQNVARALGCPVIPARSINPSKDTVFNSGTPLLYYVLAEAKKAGKVLGCVGQRIVAQVFVRVLWDTPDSILHTDFRPNPSLIKLAPEKPKFSFGDLLVDAGLAPRTS